MSLTLEALDVRHDSYTKEFWDDLDALYRGGKAFRNRIQNFLPQNELEPSDVYHKRKHNATYRSYMGPIIDYYAAWLFSADFVIRAHSDGKTIDAPPEYAELREDIGGDVDMKVFVKERFTKSLIQERSHWLCELPATKEKAYPADKAQFENEGFKKACLKKVDAEELLYWELDDDGRLEWCVIHSIRKTRKSISSATFTFVETWAVYDKENCTTYQLEYEKGQRPSDPKTVVPETFKYKHGFLQVPLITLQIPEGMWIANRVYDPQTAHFRLGSALDWSIKRTCYSMPVLKLTDDGKDFTFGAGYYIKLGTEESMEWPAPPTQQFDAISNEVDVHRNDIFRMTHQMALGLDNNAETVGRSADSKDQDNAATRIMLHAYGEIVSKAIEETYELISDAFGDTDVSWSIEGMSGYDTATAPEVIANATNVQLLNIPSKTFLTEIKTKAAMASVPDASQGTKDLIRKEIAEGVEHAGDQMDTLYAGFTNIKNRTTVADVREADAEKARIASEASAKRAAAGGGSKPSKPKASS